MEPITSKTAIREKVDHVDNDDDDEEERKVLRDYDELEGTLLVASPVGGVAGGGGAPQDAHPADTLLPTAIPVSFFEYSQEEEGDQQNDQDNEEEQQQQEALYVPSMDDSVVGTRLNNPVRDKVQVDRATHQGKMKAELEVEDIQRGNRQVFAINYYSKQEVARANQRAAAMNQREEEELQGLTSKTQTTTPTAASAEKTKSPPVRAPEFYKGSYGSEYQVSTYEVESYATKDDYKVSEYKSVYEP